MVVVIVESAVVATEVAPPSATLLEADLAHAAAVIGA